MHCPHCTQAWPNQLYLGPKLAYITCSTGLKLHKSATSNEAAVHVWRLGRGYVFFVGGCGKGVAAARSQARWCPPHRVAAGRVAGRAWPCRVSMCWPRQRQSSSALRVAEISPAAHFYPPRLTRGNSTPPSPHEGTGGVDALAASGLNQAQRDEWGLTMRTIVNVRP